MRNLLSHPDIFNVSAGRAGYFEVFFPKLSVNGKNMIQIFVSSCSYKIFHNAFLKSFDAFGTKMLTRLRLGFSHLCDRKFK